MRKLNVLTACSGIGAPEHAWRDLPFNFIGCSEIEPFPSAVLQHHYPTVKNYGDMNNYKDWKFNGATPDILFSGTPCQSFSISGLRAGLDSPNGNLALVFVAMVERFNPRWVVWENVVGTLSSNRGNDLFAICHALAKCGYWWAYRVLDSSGWGIPQRRRRIYLIASNRSQFHPAAVLFEQESLFRDSTKGQGTRQNITAPIENSSGATVYENHATDSRIKVVDACPTITARWGTGGNNTPIVMAVHQNQRQEVRLSNTAFTFSSSSTAKPGQGRNAVILENQTVRRLMPSEAEQLMGFEKGYSAIDFKGKPASDANRYKALGNSMAVPVVKWIGERIQMVEAVSDE